MMNRDKILNLIEEMSRYKQDNGKGSNSVDNSLKRIIEIQNLLNNKFSLVFVTDKGIGKTSIINYILDLIFEREKKLKSGRKALVYQDVLETGAGATTTSETEIIQSKSESCELEIIPSSREEMEDLLRDFSKYIFKEIYADFQGYSSIAPELFRAMRNMTGLKEEESEDGQKVDLAKQLAKNYNINDYLLFEGEILKRANLDNRVRAEFVISKDGDEKKFIRSTFNKINLMSIDDIPLPKKVIVKLTKDIFDFDTLGPIDRIIDTRGLESGVVATDRKDIKELFRKDKNKIVMLVDKFNSPSQSIMKLIDTYIREEDNETINRVGYLVNFRDGEPENVVLHSGKTYSEILGIDAKCQDIHKYIKGNNISLRLDNIIFTNPKRYIDSNGKILIDEEDILDYGDPIEARKAKKDIRLEKKRELLCDIYRIAENYRKELLRELDIINDEFRKLKNKEIEELKLDFYSIIEYIDNFDIGDKCTGNNPFTILEEYISNCHHSILMALNNRYGVYSNKDIYLVGSNKVEELFRSGLKDMTVSVINMILGQITTQDGKDSVSLIINDIKRYYISFIDEINNFVYEHLKNSVFDKEDYGFWRRLTDRWGKGNGYVNAIEMYYRQQLEKEQLDQYIKNASFEWVRTFKNGLIAVIEEFI